ncbi:MAG: hypothetical protein RL226_2176 [Bacteroidota bacterium]
MTLRTILGDQLNLHHPWFKEVDPNVVYLMVEARSETDYATHHIQKIIAFFAAMRCFAEELKQAGHHLIYLPLDHPDHGKEIRASVLRIAHEYQCDRLEYQEPDEWRMAKIMEETASHFASSQQWNSHHFIATDADFNTVFGHRKSYRMEDFYRFMRKKTGVLMHGDQPAGDRWNFDSENRKRLPNNHSGPMPLLFDRDCTDIHRMIVTAGVKTIGTVDAKHFLWPVTRSESLQLLHFFVEECLPHFGDFQDAMTPFGWSLYHSRLSFALNVKLLHPLEVIHAVEEAWKQRPNEITLAQAEGFIRQILGWREFMRGVYRAQMPQFAALNFFNHQRKLPSWFWDGKTDMACLKHAITQSLQFAYAHHIQRLMITGNFALLAGIHPDEVDAWYLGIYIDALEWVEITNTRGMSQFADGGLIASKPYISGGSYINKMSHYCTGCKYKVNQRTGPESCPFNALYWNFLDQHRDKLGNNHRLAMPYKTWDKMAPKDRTDTLERAAQFLNTLEEHTAR